MKLFSVRTINIVVSAIVLISLYSCSDDGPFDDSSDIPETQSYDGQFLQDYINLTCRITQTTDGFFPTHAARAYGYIGLAAYETVVHGIGSQYSMQGQLQAIDAGSLPKPETGQSYHWALACNAATAHMMRRMFDKNLSAANRALIDEMESNNSNALKADVPESVVLRSERYGRDVSQVIYEISQSDGGHEAYLQPFAPDYTPAGDFAWIPTGSDQTPLSPEWPENRSFLSGIVSESQPQVHLPFSSDVNSAFYGQAMDVYEQVTLLNAEEQRTIARYWADDPFETCTPAGHTFNIMAQLLEESNATLEKTAVGIAMMAIAENDAFISCWRSKYDYDLIRPVSYIQRYIDPSFRTVIGTPPFPAYTSGHSAEIGAGTQIFVHLFAQNSEGDYSFTDLSQIQYGFAPRTYDNFYDMADECALSRYYGGIHFEMDNSFGLDIGFAVGDRVINGLRWPSEIQ